MPALPAMRMSLFIKEGFAWPAFFFPFIWLPARQLWFSFLMYVLALIALALLEWAFALDGSSVFGLFGAPRSLAGARGEQPARRAAARRGYVGRDRASGAASRKPSSATRARPVAAEPPPGRNRDRHSAGRHCRLRFGKSALGRESPRARRSGNRPDASIAVTCRPEKSRRRPHRAARRRRVPRLPRRPELVAGLM